MNAKELHDLYAPLWALVPETEPRTNVGGHSLVLCFDGSVWGWGCEVVGCDQACRKANLWGYDGEDIIEDDLTLGVCAAAAICRVSVEDWLLSQGCSLRIDVDTEGVYIEDYRGGCGGGGAEHFEAVEGPTVLHALVSAAMAVAKAKT